MLFRVSPGPPASNGAMMTAHQRGVCVIAVYTRSVAETKAKERVEQAIEFGRCKGYLLFFTTEPEE